MKNMKWLGVTGVFVGMSLSRILSRSFGVNGQLALVFSILAIFLVYILYLMIRRQFFAGLFMSIMVFPLIIMFIGMYKDNLIVASCGIGSIFIVYPLFIKWVKGLDKDNLWNHKGRW